MPVSDLQADAVSAAVPLPLLDRATAALVGLAIGDALGMPSQTLAKDEIVRRYGRISGFVEPFPGHPVSHGLRAGCVTDDTEQALLLAERLVAAPGAFDARSWADDLLDWEDGVRRRGLHDLLGPSTRSALAAIQSGIAPELAGRSGTTNGAAMRIPPLGIAVPADDLSRLVARVAEICAPTHNTGEAIGAAAAVATVVSLGVEGRTFESALPRAIEAARLGSACGHPEGERDMAGRIALALEAAGSGGVDAVASRIGTSVASRASVAAAFAVVRLSGGDPWAAAVIAANIGDDTDTIGAIAGAMAGACTGLAGIPDAARQKVERANSLDLGSVAARLCALRLQTPVP